MEHTERKVIKRPTEGSNPPPRRRSVMPNMPCLQMVIAGEGNPQAEKIPDPDMPPIQMPPRRKKKRFEDSFTRFTYLEKSLHTYVLELRYHGHIESATSLVNDALLEYIKKHFDKSFEK